jgi:hypothetical protein
LTKWLFEEFHLSLHILSQSSKFLCYISPSAEMGQESCLILQVSAQVFPLIMFSSKLAIHEYFMFTGYREVMIVYLKWQHVDGHQLGLNRSPNCLSYSKRYLGEINRCVCKYFHLIISEPSTFTGQNSQLLLPPTKPWDYLFMTCCVLTRYIKKKK